ncbi:MAG: ABC transporter permease, partial [Dokdonella sp.]
MEALRRFAAIVLADLRERSRSTRFWVVLGLVSLVTWWCFPGIETGRFTVGFATDQRAAYSSAWVGLVLGLMYSTMLSLIGFYLVRGTLVRDFDTRVWQLLVATPMTRAGYLLAKWTSHMAVFALIMLVGLAIGAAAQWVRAEDHAFDLIELFKPVAVLALPSLALTAFFAVLFDLVPWLRHTAGNVLFFFVWSFLFVTLGVAIDPHKSA